MLSLSFRLPRELDDVARGGIGILVRAVRVGGRRGLCRSFTSKTPTFGGSLARLAMRRCFRGEMIRVVR